MSDRLEVSILPDGSLRVETGKISMPNHANAESFLADLARGCGGVTERKRKIGFSHVHVVNGVTHTHTHTH